MNSFQLLEIILFSIIISKAFGEDYCNSKLCNGREHIGCRNPGHFSSNCPRDREAVILSAYDKQTILNQHNNIRNKIASGSLKGFCSASRMATIQWSSELEKLAQLNALKCRLKHDSCRNTKDFEYAGQSLATESQNPEFHETNAALLKAMEQWFNAHKEANQNVINKCCGPNLVKYGHFIQMVNDHATHIGCAASKYTSNNFKTTLITCNYSRGNVKGFKVYTCGKPGSECRRGRNPEFNALCNVNEPIDPNDLD